MRVQLLYFGVLRDIVGAGTEQVELPEPATAGDLLRILAIRTSNASMEPEIWKSLAVAVNREYVSAAAVLHEGDEVALLPPVSGGCFAPVPSPDQSHLPGSRSGFHVG